MFDLFRNSKSTMVTPEKALPGRASRPFALAGIHTVLRTPIDAPLQTDQAVAVLGLGCFWGEEQTFWQVPGVYSTSVGYAGGFTPNPSYEEVCSARTGHAEVVRVVFDTTKLSYADLLKVFWENHNPTQGMRQGNDIGSQYRSVILTTTPEQQAQAEASKVVYQKAMSERGYGEITTAIEPLREYYFAEDYHQQYLDKNPGGYCPLHATGVKYADA
ncbi:MAG TPA: peptide-methionine (S)-S-oxide reductase MsrA [Actinopolymorphaceae bacterium]|jgi:peptide-methionine (S)-S-oxide reductase